MFIPFVSHFRARVDTNDGTRPSDSNIHLIFVKEPSLTHPPERRKGGGGGGGGRGRGPSSSSSALSVYPPYHYRLSLSLARVGGSSGGKSGKTSKVSLGSGSLPNGKTSATSYGAGGGRVVPIAHQPFVGRLAGGGNREEVYGNRYAIHRCDSRPWS